MSGAVFGLLFYEVRQQVCLLTRADSRWEWHSQSTSLCICSHTVSTASNPARGEPGVPRLLPNPRVFGQATWRHALFGASARTTRVSLLD
jgi:hypothetical protein